MLQPQEVEVFYILPAIRNELAVAMKSLGKPQKEIAGLLGVTEAAVSQYVSKKRGTLDLPQNFKNAIISAAARITDTQSMIRETQAIVTMAKEQRLICQLHERLEGEIPKGCDVCFK